MDIELTTATATILKAILAALGGEPDTSFDTTKTTTDGGHAPEAERISGIATVDLPVGETRIFAVAGRVHVYRLSADTIGLPSPLCVTPLDYDVDDNDKRWILSDIEASDLRGYAVKTTQGEIKEHLTIGIPAGDEEPGKNGELRLQSEGSQYKATLRARGGYEEGDVPFSSDRTIYVPDQDGTMLVANNPTYADLATANAALGIGKIYYDLSTECLEITTA